MSKLPQCFLAILLLSVQATNLKAQEPGSKMLTIVEKSRVSIIGAKEPIDLDLGTLVTVREVRGEQLEVETHRGLGVIPKRNVVALDRATEFWTQKLSKSPRDVQLLSSRGKTYALLREFDKAIADYNAAIKINPRYATTYVLRGMAYYEKNDKDRALADFGEAIRYDSKLVGAYLARGQILRDRGDFKRALADYDQAIALDPESVHGHEGRGLAHEGMRDVRQAVTDYKQALKLNSRSDNSLNNLAWILATHPDAGIRNGQEAVEYATKNCEVSGWDQPGNLDTLAAAYAEGGDFENAVKWQSKAVELAPAAEKADYLTRVMLYQSKKPYRDQK